MWGSIGSVGSVGGVLSVWEIYARCTSILHDVNVCEYDNCVHLFPILCIVVLW